MNVLVEELYLNLIKATQFYVTDDGKGRIKRVFLKFLSYYYDISQLQDILPEQTEETVLT